MSMTCCRLRIDLDESTANEPLFQTIREIEVTKPQLFKLGMMNDDPPDYIDENDFDYIQSAFPKFEAYYDKYVELDENRILNRATGETTGRISEIAGVGCGLIYATQVLGVDAKSVSKIPRAEGKRKYLDFSIRWARGTAEFESKGTTRSDSVSGMLADIDAKKADSSASFKFGAVTVARKAKDRDPSFMVIRDDPPPQEMRERRRKQGQVLRELIAHYVGYLSFFLDSGSYNGFVRQLRQDSLFPPRIDIDKIPQSLILGNKVYVGEFFDRRLITHYIGSRRKAESPPATVLHRLTKRVGVTKYFFGMDKYVLELYNARDAEGLEAYRHDPVRIDMDQAYTFVDEDGIAIIKSVDASNAQLESRFTEGEVLRRLVNYLDYLNRKPHVCGAPCRSRDRKGKPCAIKTYRTRCHFHR